MDTLAANLFNKKSRPSIVSNGSNQTPDSNLLGHDLNARKSIDQGKRFLNRQSIADISNLRRRMSKFKLEVRRKAPSAERKPKYENTYRTEPANGKKFMPEQAQRVMYETIERIAKGSQYDPIQCGFLSRSISDEIKDQLRIHLNIPRYKITCYVVIAQQLGQGIQMGSRCVWDDHHDGHASAKYENEHLMIMASAFLTYFD